MAYDFQTLGSWTNFLHQTHVSVFGMGFQSNPKEGYPHNIYIYNIST